VSDRKRGSDYLPEKTTAEWRAENKALLAKSREDYTKNWDFYARKYLDWHGEVLSAEWRVAQSVLKAPSVAARWLIGNSGEALGLWESDLHREFRYTNQPAFAGYAAYGRQFLSALTSNPARAALLLSGNHAATAAVAAEAQAGWMREQDAGHPWVKANPEAAEEIVLGTLDPMWIAGWGLSAAKAGLLSAEMKILRPIASDLMIATEAKHHTDLIKFLTTEDSIVPFTLKASELHGGDVVNPSFRQMVAGMHRNGASIDEVAMELWTQGYRASPWSIGMDEFPVGKFFKRGGSVTSPAISDLAKAKEEIQQSIMHDRIRALESVGEFDTVIGETADRVMGRATEADLIQELIEKVPREPWAPGQTFEANYLAMAHQGQAPIVPPSTLEKARKVAENLRLGFREGIDKTTGKPFPWMSRYSPAASTVKKVEAANGVPEAEVGKVYRHWELAREGGPGRFHAAEDFRSWVASVSTRLKRADKIDAFVAQANIYKKTISDAGAQATGMEKLKFRQQYKMVNHLIRDLKEWKTTPDYIRAIKRSESDGGKAVAPIFKAYDKLLNVIRTGQVLASPSVIINNTLDSNVIKNAAEVGRVDWRGLAKVAYEGAPQPAYGFDGRTLSFSGNPSTAVMGNVGDVRLLGSRSLARARDAMARVLDATETQARNALGQFVYDQNLSRMVKGGIDGEVAHGRAYQLAKDSVASVHFDYGTQSSFDKIARRVWMYPVFGLRNSAFMVTKAAQYPTEFYALTRLREMQREGSIDREGSLKIPGFDYAVDPSVRMSPVRIMDALINSKRELTPEENREYRAGKMLSLVMGSFTPPVEALLGALGAVPDTGGGTVASIESMAGLLNKNLTGREIYPSDWGYNLIGKDPKESRDEFLARRAELIGIASRREGYETSPQQAADLAKHYDNVVKTASWAGLRLVPASSGIASVTADLADAKWHLVNANPEFADARKALILGQSRFADLNPVLPKTPNERLAGSIQRSGMSEDKATAELRTVGPRADGLDQGILDERTKTLIDVLGKSPALAPFRWLAETLVTPAGAAESIGQRDQKPTPGVRWKENSTGQLVPEIPEGKSLHDMAAEFNAAQSQVRYINSTFLNDLSGQGSKVQSAEQLATYIDGLVDENGYNFAPELISQLRASDKVAPIYEQYTAFKSGEKSGNASIATPAIRAGRQNFAIAFKDWVGEGGKDAQSRLDAPLSVVRAAMASGEIYTANMPPEAVDNIALRLARRGADGAAYGAVKSFESEKRRAYPGNELLRSRLQSAADHQPNMTPGSVDMTNAAIAAGGVQVGETVYPVSPDFWQLMKDGSMGAGSAGLHERVAVLDDYDNLASLAKKISLTSASTGRLVAVNIPAMVDAIYADPDNRVRLSALRGGALGDGLANAFEATFQASERNGNPFGYSGDQLAPLDQAGVGGMYAEDFAFRSGAEKHPLFQDFSPTPMDPTAEVLIPRDIDGRVPQSRVDGVRAIAALDLTRPLSASRQIPIMSIEPLAKQRPMAAVSAQPGIALRDRPYDSIGSWLSDSIRQSSATGNSLMVTGHALMRTENVDQAGVITKGGTSIPWDRTLHAATSLASVANQLEGGSNQDVSAGISGAGAALSVFSAGSALVGSGAAAGAAATGTGMFAAGSSASAIAAGSAPFGPVGWAVAAVAIGAGIAIGVMGSKKKGGRGGYSQEQLAANAERLALQKQQFEEQQSRQAARDIQVREQTLARAFQTGGMTPQQRAQIQPQLQAFQRRPSYQSRIGLVDAAERAVGSALKPRW
jgi:hypothetical protein